MLTGQWSFAVASVVAAEGTTAIVPIVWSNYGIRACSLQYGTGPDSGGIPPGNPYSNFVPANMGWTTEPPSGEIDVKVPTLEDAGSPFDDPSHLVAFDSSIYSYDGGNGQQNIQATIDIVEPFPTPGNCGCSCSCGNVEPNVTPQAGGPTANTGQGRQPQDLYYYGLANPHPIASVNDTLSSTVAHQASDIMVQTTLDDLAGNVLYTAPTEYYSPAGYTNGQQVQFSTQLNAAGLADGLTSTPPS